MAASYPTASKSFSTKATTNVIEAEHVNSIQDEIVAIEQALLTVGLAHNLIPSTSGARSLGTSALKWSELHLSGAAAIGGTLAVTGAATLSSTLAVTGAATLSSTLGVTGDIAVNTNKFNIAALTGNTTIAGTLGVTGATTLAGVSATTGAFSSTLAVTGNSTLTGSVGIGVAPTYPLHVAKAIANDWTGWLENPTATGPNGLRILYSGAAPNGVNNQFIYAEDNLGQRFSVRSNGGIANYSANDVNLSDDRAKDYDGPLTQDVIDAEVAAFLNLELRKGKYKDSADPHTHLMLSAQQVEASCPEWCGTFDAKKGLKGTREYLIQLAAYATIQQLAKRIAALEAR